MAATASTTAQRIRAKAEAAAKAAQQASKESKNAPKPAKGAAKGPAKANRTAKTATGTAKQPFGQSQGSKTGSKNPKPAAKGPVRAEKVIPRPDVSEPEHVEPANWEVEYEDPVVANGVDAGEFGGVEEVPVGHNIGSGYDSDGNYEYGLRKTTTPGVYLNSAGIMVDKNGIALNFQKVKKADDDRWAEILGKPLETPAELLKAVSLDPTKPLAMRIDAAKSAAPYTDRKKPIGIDGGKDGEPILMSIKELRGLPMAALLAIEQTIQQNLLEAETSEAEDKQ